jgi:serine/threonine-protein kinase
VAKLPTAQTAATTDASDSPTLTLAATQAGMILGTAAYMSPEQARGEPVDKRADVWAFGVVLWEMLTGKRLFRGKTTSDVLASVLREEPDLTRVPPKVRPLLKRCLEKDPQRRLRDIGDAMGIIESAPEGLRVRRSWAPWAVTGVLTIIAVIALLGWWRTTRPVGRPMMRFSVDLGPEAMEGSHITTAISPDGMRLTFVVRGPGGKEQLATRLLDQAISTILAGTENAADPFFSPDGQWIGFFADGKLKKISVQGGGTVTLCDVLVAPVGASWTEDGSIILTLGMARASASRACPQREGHRRRSPSRPIKVKSRTAGRRSCLEAKPCSSPATRFPLDTTMPALRCFR